MRPILLLFLYSCCRLIEAQPGCPAAQFQGTVSTPAAPSSSSHIVVARQPGGTYTAYEITNASPYRIIRATLDYAATLDACLPHRGSGPAIAPPAANFGNPMGATSQVSAYAVLASGNILSVTPGAAGLDVAEFNSNMQLASEDVYPQFVSTQALQSILLVDLNGDGNPDIVGVNPGLGKSIANGSIVVLVGNGGTSFQAGQTYPIGAQGTQTVAAGDFNGDHKLDLAVATAGFGGNGSGRVSILPGNGDGTFQPEQIRFSSVNASAIAVGDVNGDGKADLAFTSSNDSPPQTLTVALGNGDGTFGAATTYAVGGADAVAIGDVNGDGFPDIVTSGASILFGNGRGYFPTRRDYLERDAPIQLFDFDGDGNVDIVAAPGNPFLFSGNGELAVLFGQGDGNFAGAPAISTGATGIGAAIATADFNGDGNPDLVAAQSQGNISVLVAESGGTFRSIYQFNLESGFNELPTALVAGDFSKDGHGDFAVLAEGSSLYGPQAYLAIFLGDGKGNFTASNTMVAGRNALGLTAADFNGDGNLDLAFTEGAGLGPEGGITILLGDGQGNFNLMSGYVTGPKPFTVVAGDFNGDGKPDLAVTNRPGEGLTQPGNVSVFLGKGDGTFSAGAIIPVAGAPQYGPYAMIAADLNGDGKVDLAFTIANESTAGSGVGVLLGNGDGTFQPAVIYGAASANLNVADLNGDGIPDLVLSATPGAPGFGVLIGNGDGNFQPEVAIPTSDIGSGAIGPMAAADFNHDGKIDLAGMGGPLGVAILLNISQPAPPFATVSSASFAYGFAAPESLVTAFGKNFASGTASEQGLPLPFSLAGTSVSVTDATGTMRPAPLLYVSPTQINFEIPAGVGTGTRNITIAEQGGSTQTASIAIQPVAPSLFQLNAAGLAAASIVSIANGVQSYGNVYAIDNGVLAAAPVNLTPDAVYLVLYGTGIRGAGGAVTADIQGFDAEVTYAGPQLQFPGLDQVNVLLPKSLAGAGIVNIVLTAAGAASNTVTITIQ